MNMISTGAFLPEMDASNKQETVAEKFARVWEKKNSKVARAGGVSLMALSLAACGSSSDDTAVTSGTGTDTGADTGTDTGSTTPAIAAREVLTSDIDSVTATTVVGDNTGTTNTVSAADEVNGGGSGTFDYYGAAASVVLPLLDGVAVINLHNPGVITALNTVNDADVTTVNIVDQAIGANSPAGIALSATQTLGFVDTTQTAGQSVTATFDDGTVANLAVSNAQIAVVAANGDDVVEVAVSSTGSDANSIEGITSTGTEATLTITGNQDLTITNAMAASVATVAAGTASGDVAVEVATDVSTADTSMTVTMGSGDDTLNTGALLDEGSVNAAATIALDGGDGEDTLAVDAQIDADVTVDGTADIVNFEVLQVEADVAYDLDGYDWVEQLNINADITNEIFDNITDSITTNLILTTTDLTLQHADDSALGTQTLNVTIGGAAAVTATTVTLDGVENIAITSGGTAANEITNLEADEARSVTLTVNEDLTLGASSDDVLDSIIASGDGALDLTIGTAQTSAIIITSGGGDDTITGAEAQVVTLAHQINGGDGDDTFVVSDAVDLAYDFTSSVELTSIENITVLGNNAGTDVLTFDQADLAVSALDLTLTNGADAEDDTVTIEAGAGNTDFQAAAETALADVNVAGEWFLDNTGATDGVLHFYNEELGGVTALTLVGLDAGAVAVAGGDITWTA